MTPAPHIPIRRAAAADLPALADLLTEAFLHGDLAPWLVAHLDTRHRIYRPYFGMIAEHALEHGHVEITGDGTAAAVWFRVTDQPLAEPDDYAHRLAAITGSHLARFQALDLAIHTAHPYTEPHHYLAYLAVQPDRQRRGLGSALLAHHHAQLDQQGIPAYLEATGSRNRSLYARHGYRPRPPIALDRGGPHLHPMWRPAPHPTDRTVEGRTRP